jgi:two-component system OmpR family sensor kinase
MDGHQRRLNPSLQLRLSLWLMLVIGGIALLAGVFSYVAAFEEAHELQDDMLRQIAALLGTQYLPAATASARVADGELASGESRVTVQALSSHLPLALPVTLLDGLQTTTVDGTSYRVLVKTLASGERIAMTQDTRVRDDAAHDSAVRTLMPFLVLLPVLLLVVAHLVRKIFQPIAALSLEIDQRSEHALHPFSAHDMPTEVRPFVVAINRLLGRVAQAMEAQRRFVADAAHELRSPLTALSLQAERLADTALPDTARQRLTTLREGINRGRALLDQLLTLARVQSHTSACQQPGLHSVQQVFRRVLEDLLPLAEAKNIDLGVENDLDAQVLAYEVDLVTLVKNLVDNAIRYTPPGGRIDLAVQPGPGLVEVWIRDTGPGIPLVEQGRVFDPFYRVLGHDSTGSGLGLSIVQAIAERMGAQVQLGYADGLAQTGLAVQVVLHRSLLKT